MRARRALLAATALAATCLLSPVSAGSPWPASAYARAKAVLAGMSTADIFQVVHGSGGPYVGDVPAIPSLFPALHLEDGPQGVADGITNVTAFPSALSVVASWDPEAMALFGRTMAEEQYAKGA